MTPNPKVASILAKLDGVRPDGSGWKGRCPTHEDHNPSLSVANGRNGGVAMLCRAGCDTEGVRTALGLSWADLFADDDRPTTPASPTMPKRTAYELRDPSGSLVAIHVRLDYADRPKGYEWRSADGTLGLKGMRPADAPLYLTERLRDADTVVVTEGERDADAVADYGIPVVGTATGAAGTPSAASLAVLKGRHVVLWPDNDDVGRAHMARIAAKLDGVAASVHTITWAKAPSGGGAADYDGDPRALIDAALTPEDEPMSMSAFLAKRLDPPAWIVADLVPKGPAVGGLFGATKSGKSLLGLQLCFVTALGMDFMGLAIENGGATLFVEYEGSEAALQARAASIAAKLGALNGDIPVSVKHRPKIKLDTDAGEAWLTRHCRGRVLCVIGPVSKCASIKDENNAAEWQTLAERMQRVADATGCTVLLVHHTRKPDRMMGLPSRVSQFFDGVRGSNAYMGAVDVALGIQRDPEATEGTLFYLERDGQSGRKGYSFDRQSLCIWPDERAMVKATVEDRIALTRRYIEEHPGVNRSKLMQVVNVTEDTLKGYLKRIDGLVEGEDPADQTRTYTVTGVS